MILHGSIGRLAGWSDPQAGDKAIRTLPEKSWNQLLQSSTCKAQRSMSPVLEADKRWCCFMAEGGLSLEALSLLA
jgi:hypothetical protein